MSSSDTRCILIADDEADIREVLRLYLENAGFQVVEAADGQEALDILATRPIDLCLLDIMMPKVNGYELLRKLRETAPTPVILISAKGQDAERVIGLDLGADDYLVKPFNPLEVVARAKSLMRRVYAIDAQPLPSQTDANTANNPAAAGKDTDEASDKDEKNRQLKVRDLVLDLDACELHRGDEDIELTSVEFRVLELLMSHPGRVFTKQQIYERGWGEPYMAAGNNVMVCISKLRSKLGDESSTYIRTIRGLGYRLER